MYYFKKAKLKVRKKLENSYSRKFTPSKFSGYTVIAHLNAISNMYGNWHFDNYFISIFRAKFFVNFMKI